MTAPTMVTVAIATKNRPDSLQRCLAGIRAQTYPRIEIVVVDDGSSLPLNQLGNDVRLIRNEVSLEPAAARNQALAISNGDLVAFFDDDAEPADPTLIARAAAWWTKVPSLAAVAFRQLKPDGEPHPQQPADSADACYAPFFFSYGCVIARSAIGRVGGFADLLGYLHEEVELSLRFLNANLRIIYDPSLSVIHHFDLRQRNLRGMRLRTLRNSTLTALLRYPSWAIPPAVFRYWLRYAKLAGGNGAIDWQGLRETLSSVAMLAPPAWHSRSCVKARTLARARKLRLAPEPLSR